MNEGKTGKESPREWDTIRGNPIRGMLLKHVKLWDTKTIENPGIILSWDQLRVCIE